MTRSRLAHALIASAWLIAVAALVGLGSWQVERRAWKLDLIAWVDARLQAPPVPAPVSAGSDDAYRRVSASGSYVSVRDTFVQASTERGPGWWVLTPLRSGDRIILVNRGYVAQRQAPPPPPHPQTITGLLRLTEPRGGFLRTNDPGADRWYSRDVAAIAARRGLGSVAPYFIDADAAPGPPDAPVGGLTVVSFPNNHLVYAITWYVLAAMALAGFLYWVGLIRRDRRDG